MKLMSVISAILLLCPFSLSYGQTCKGSSADLATKPVDLTSQFGELRNQDSVGWCYAFTAADLLTHYLHRTGQLSGNIHSSEGNVSPVGIAAWFNKGYFKDYYKTVQKLNSSELDLFNQKMREKKAAEGEVWEDLLVVPEGGFIDTAINDAQNNGYCLEKDAPSESFSVVMAKFCMEKGICATDLKEILELIYDRAKFKAGDQKAICDLYEVAQAAYPNIPEKNLRSIMSKTARDRVFYDLASAACKNKLKLKAPKPLAKTLAINEEINEPNDKLFVLMDKLLDKGLPAGISYYSAFLKQSNAPQNDPHASSIVGKKYDPATCEVKYILRNSWGPGCSDYQTKTPAYWSCIKGDNKEFSKAKSDLKDKIHSLQTSIDKIEEKIKKFNLPSSEKNALENQLSVMISEQIDLQVKLDSYSIESSFAKEVYCTDKNPAVYRNPKISCDPKTGYLSIGKNELKKYLTEVSYIE